MAEPSRPADPMGFPEAVAAPRSRRTIQLVWLVPLVAVLIGGWLAVKAIMERGPEITISFDTADGLEAGKTKIKFKDVEIGLVKSVVISRDTKGVIATAELVKDAARFLVDDTRFWVVRPRISGGTVSGLGTLLSGSYIGIDAGKSDKSRREFAGLKLPPVIATDTPGREYILRAKSIGSLDAGSPIFFRRLQVGQITGYELDKDGTGVTLKVFVNTPYEGFITANTRFWHASGVDVTLDANGLNVQTESVVAIVLGGIAFETPAEGASLPVAAADAKFTLFDNRVAAMKNPDQEVLKFVMVFRESVRGLVVGAPLDFRGVVMGEVAAIRLDVDEKNKHINVPVEVNVYPARLRTRSATERHILSDAERKALIGAMVARGMRGQLRTGSLLTGQLYIAIDFFPGAPKATIGAFAGMSELPVMPSTMTEIQETIASIAKKVQELDLKQLGTDMHETLVKIQALQFDRVGDDMHSALQNADKMMLQIDTALAGEGHEVLVEARKALGSVDQVLKPDSPLSQDARDAMRELARAAQAIRILADYLERHPEALIKGKKEEQQ